MHAIWQILIQMLFHTYSVYKKTELSKSKLSASCRIKRGGNWKNQKLCENTTPAERSSVFAQRRAFSISRSVDINVYQ